MSKIQIKSSRDQEGHSKREGSLGRCTEQDLTTVSAGDAQITNLPEEGVCVAESEGVSLNKSAITEGLKSYTEEFWQK